MNAENASSENQENQSVQTPIPGVLDKPALKIMITKFIYGGLHPMTDQCFTRDLIGHLKDPDHTYEIHLGACYNDALIDRARSSVAEGFLKSNMDVLVMVDHDLSWEAGDMLRIARKAHELQGIVGAAVSKRNRGEGIASVITEPGSWQVGTDRIVNASYVGSAFTAFPRKVVEAVASSMRNTVQGFRPMFIPDTSIFKDNPSLDWYESEDWAFCRRALDLGFKCYVDLKPQVGHWGVKCYTVGDAYEGIDRTQFFKPPTFSLIHATRGRPEMAIKARENWLSRASGLHSIQYIYSCDDDDPRPLPEKGLPADTCIVIGQNRGNVDAYNRAAWKAATGDIFIQVHDDVLPPQNWDEKITGAIGDFTKPAVLRVGDGLPKEVNAQATPGLLAILIGTQAWFKQIGYMYHPSIISVYCDDHATQIAEKHHAIINSDLIFAHDWRGADRDETQKKSYAQENWKIGKEALDKLVSDGLKPEPELWGSCL